MANETFGKYRVVRLLGQGAMGSVYLAEDPYIGRQLAIKVMKSAGDEDRQRFVHEARTVGGLSHPNIVVLHDFGFHDDQPYLVMELLAGIGLDSWIRQSHPLSDHLRIAEGLCDALEYAHGRGVLHRDLKPSNVHVMPDGQCKLMDFGIARTADAKLTATGTILGTPAYMAPEILENASYSVGSDVYAAAVVLYEMLVGRNPFVAPSIAATLNNVLRVSPEHVSALRADVPRELGDALMACLVKDPRTRPPDMQPLLAEVRRQRHGAVPLMVSAAPSSTQSIVVPRPPSAPPPLPAHFLAPAPPAAPTASRPSRRTPLVALAAVAFLLLGLTAWRLLPTPRPATEPPGSPAPPSPATTQAPPTTIAPTPTPERRAGGAAASRRVASATPRRAAPPHATPEPTPAPPPTPLPTAEPSAALGDRDGALHDPRPAAPALLGTPAPRPPQLQSLTPRTTRRGMTVTLELRGSDLRPEQKAQVLRGRQPATDIRVTRQQVLSPTLARVTLLVDEDAPFGTYSIVLVDASGAASNALSLEVAL